MSDRRDRRPDPSSQTKPNPVEQLIDWVKRLLHRYWPLAALAFFLSVLWLAAQVTNVFTGKGILELLEPTPSPYFTVTWPPTETQKPTATPSPSTTPVPTRTPSPTPVPTATPIERDGRSFQPIWPLPGLNRKLLEFYIDFPTGEKAQTGALGEVPFFIPSQGMNFIEMDGGEIVIPVHVERPLRVYMLLTVAHGDYPKASTTVVFTIDGQRHERQLGVGQDIREWAIGSKRDVPGLVVTTTSPTTKEVWRGLTTTYGEAIMDRVEIDLSEYNGSTLSEIAIYDTEGDIIMTRLTAITVELR